MFDVYFLVTIRFICPVYFCFHKSSKVHRIKICVISLATNIFSEKNIQGNKTEFKFLKYLSSFNFLLILLRNKTRQAGKQTFLSWPKNSKLFLSTTCIKSLVDALLSFVPSALARGLIYLVNHRLPAFPQNASYITS